MARVARLEQTGDRGHEDAWKQGGHQEQRVALGRRQGFGAAVLAPLEDGVDL